MRSASPVKGLISGGLRSRSLGSPQADATQVRLNSIRERLVKARPQRGTAKTGSHAFSARSSFLTIRHLLSPAVTCDSSLGPPN